MSTLYHVCITYKCTFLQRKIQNNKITYICIVQYDMKREPAVDFSKKLIRSDRSQIAQFPGDRVVSGLRIRLFFVLLCHSNSSQFRVRVHSEEIGTPPASNWIHRIDETSSLCYLCQLLLSPRQLIPNNKYPSKDTPSTVKSTLYQPCFCLSR